MTKHWTTALVPLALVCAGCAAKPRVQSTFFAQDPPANLSDSYAFPRTFIELKPLKTDALVEVSARNQTYEGFRVGLSRDDSWGVRTFVSVTKVANSDIVDEIGVETKDDRIAMIEGIGKLITTALPLVGLSGAGCTEKLNEPALLSGSVSLDSLLAMQTCSIAEAGGSGDVASDGNWRNYKGINVWFGPVPPGATRVRNSDGSFISLAGKAEMRRVAYAACREVRLEFKVNQYRTTADLKSGKPVESATPMSVTRSIYVADPNWFRTVALPFKGKVKIHPQCGTSTTVDSTAAPSTDLAVATAIAAQAVAIQAAIEKEKAK